MPTDISDNREPPPSLPSVPSEPTDEETERCEGCGKPAVTADSDGIPLCRECYDACGPTSVESDSKITPPPAISVEGLEEAMDELGGGKDQYVRCGAPGCAFCEKQDERAATIRAARSSLKALFERQQQEISEWKGLFCETETQLSALRSEVEQARKTGNYWKMELNAANAEISRLSADRLTKAEANAIVQETGCGCDDKNAARRGFAKLRRLSEQGEDKR